MPQLPIDGHILLVTAGKIGAAYALSLPTGWWSEKQGHAVGIRTFPIVAMASCGYLLTLSGIGGSDGLSANSRVLQGLVAGIGFVGGGAIVKEGVSVRGTATAASIWNMGAIGAAIAFGRYEVAIVLALLNLLTLEGLVPLKKRLDREEEKKEEAEKKEDGLNAPRHD
jgi:putative Mg2+ transporter-C (MgtC) family protein